MSFIMALMGIGSIVQGVSMANAMKHNVADTSAIYAYGPNVTQLDTVMNAWMQRYYAAAAPYMDQMQQIANLTDPSVMPPPFPQPPSQAKESLTSQVREFYTTRNAYWKGEYQKLMEEKSATLAENHLEFDKDGNPINDLHGNPILYEGAETEEQKALREKWECKVQQDMEGKYVADRQAYISKFMESFSATVKENLYRLADPQVQKQLQEMVAKADQELKQKEYAYQSDVLKAGMPSYELKKKAEELSKGLQEEEEEFLAMLEQSPYGTQVKKYQDMAQSFLSEQKALLSQYHGDESLLTSPSLLSVFIPQAEDPELSDAIQGMTTDLASSGRDWKYQRFS